jgi:hypothetical protein
MAHDVISVRRDHGATMKRSVLILLLVAGRVFAGGTVTFHYNYYEVGGVPQCPNPYGLGQNPIRYRYHVHVGHHPSVTTYFAFKVNGFTSPSQTFVVHTDGSVDLPSDRTYGVYGSPTNLSTTWSDIVSDPAGETGTFSPASDALTAINVWDNGSPAEQDYDVHIYVLGSTPTCEDDVTVTAHWDGGAPHGAGVVVNILVGGFLGQVQCDANGCNSGTFPADKLNHTGSAPYGVDGGVDPNSWAICGVPNARYQTKVTNVGSWPTSVACGGTIDIPISANCAATPTPSPSPSASIAPSPSATPVLTPPPEPSPITYETPPPNGSDTTVTHGGTTGAGISNQDIYNDVKQALNDAGTVDSDFISPNGGFAYGNNPDGEGSGAGNGLQSAVNRFTDDLSGSSDGLMGYVDNIDSLNLPTSIGDKGSWDLTLPVLGELTVDTSAFDTPVAAFRALCLAVLIVGAWFAMIRIIRSGVA